MEGQSGRRLSGSFKDGKKDRNEEEEFLVLVVLSIPT